MDALDALTVRKRRDRLLNAVTAPYATLEAALFQYAPPPPIPPPVPPPFVFQQAQQDNGASYVPFVAPPPDVTGVKHERPDPRYHDATAEPDDKRARGEFAPDAPPPDVPAPEYMHRRAAEGVRASSYQGMHDYFKVRQGYRTRQATREEEERNRPPAENTRYRRQRTE